MADQIITCNPISFPISGMADQVSNSGRRLVGYWLLPLALPLLAHMASWCSVSVELHSMYCIFIKTLFSGLYGGIKILCYLHYFKQANINIIKRFRANVSSAPNSVLLVNANNGDRYTRQQGLLTLKCLSTEENTSSLAGWELQQHGSQLLP